MTPQPDPQVQRLAPLVGTWEAEGSTRDTALLGPGVPVRSHESFH